MNIVQQLSNNVMSKMTWSVWDLLSFYEKVRIGLNIGKRRQCLRDIEANRVKLETGLKSFQTLQNWRFFNTSKRAKNENTKKTLENVVSGSKIEQNTRVL